MARAGILFLGCFYLNNFRSPDIFRRFKTGVMRKWLWNIVEDNTTRKGRIFDYSIQALIMLSLVAFANRTRHWFPPVLPDAA